MRFCGAPLSGAPPNYILRRTVANAPQKLCAIETILWRTTSTCATESTYSVAHRKTCATESLWAPPPIIGPGPSD